MSIYREHLTLIGVLESEAAVEESEDPSENETAEEVPAFSVPIDHHDMPDFSDFELKDE